LTCLSSVSSHSALPTSLALTPSPSHPHPSPALPPTFNARVPALCTCPPVQVVKTVSFDLRALGGATSEIFSGLSTNLGKQFRGIFSVISLTWLDLT
jgi:hypothetical protein